jgi:hypothetical protein
VTVLRNQEWVRLPKNIIVEGDYIKINVGDKSPADVKCVDYRYDTSNRKWDYCLKKDEIFKDLNQSFNDSYMNIMINKNKYDKM